MAKITKPKKPKVFNFKSWLISTLRRASYRWPPRNDALKAARVSRGVYKCELCQADFAKKDIKIDHRIPVIDVKDGFVSWDSFIDRLFCDASNFSIICATCHDSKTATEREMRKHYKDAKKNSD